MSSYPTNNGSTIILSHSHNAIIAAKSPDTSDSTLLFTVPLGQEYIITSLNVCCSTAANGKFDVIINTGGIDYYLEKNSDALAGLNSTQILQNYRVKAGDSIYVRNIVASTIDFVLTGIRV